MLDGLALTQYRRLLRCYENALGHLGSGAALNVGSMRPNLQPLGSNWQCYGVLNNQERQR